MDNISSAFERHVLATPHATAVIFGHQSLTYQELNWRANCLALQLQAMNIRPDKQVALCMERSLEQIIAIFGILKAGGAYVPMDPNQPTERLISILREGDISILITRGSDAPRLKNLGESHQTLFLNDPFFLTHENALSKDQIKIPSLVLPEHLAYVIYTSGTTGSPKGVMIEQHSVVNFCKWFAGFSQAYAGQRVDWSGNYIFDMAVTTSIVPMMLGMTIIMCEDEIKKNPLFYLNYLKENQINMIKISPSYLREMVREALKSPCDLSQLETLILGGERLFKADCQKWLELYPQQVIYNEYGPTEATVAVSHQKVCKDNIHHFENHIPIGQAGDNMPCYVLNPENEPVSMGEVGELHIGGNCLARGYINQPELTSQKFIPNTLNSERPEGRLYKTGDLCRQLDGNCFEILGRIDTQIKIRGFRVEPGEIELCLRKHPAFLDAIVVLHEDETAQHPARLIAYCILKSPLMKVSYPQMRKYLQAFLPDYMVPNAFIPIDKIPLTANSKLDCRALPAPGFSGSEDYVAPKTVLEKKLATIWSKELELPAIGVHDNFFELGGNSLQAARIVAEIKQCLHKNLSLEGFYAADNIKDLAVILKNTQHRIKADVSLAPTRPYTALGDQSRLPLGDFQLLLWMLARFEPKTLCLNLISRKRWQGATDKITLAAAFQALLVRHPILNGSIGKYYPAHICDPKAGPKRFKLLEGTLGLIDKMPKKAIEHKLFLSSQELLKVRNWPNDAALIQARAFYLPNDVIELQIALPHIIADEISIEILWEDLGKFYEAFKNSPKPLSLSTIRPAPAFNQYVQKEQADIAKFEDKDTAFWESYADNTSPLSFPKRHTIPSMPEGCPYSLYYKIPTHILTTLEQYCAFHHLGLNAVLSAAVSLVLSAYSDTPNSNKNKHKKDKKFFVNIVKSTRNAAIWDEIIGCFIRTDPIKVSVNQEDNLLSLAKQIQNSLIQTIKPMQASTILKLATINAQNKEKKFAYLLRPLVSLGITAYSWVLKHLNLEYSSLENLKKYALYNRKSSYSICVNLNNNFIEPGKNTKTKTIEKQAFWANAKKVPFMAQDLMKFDNVCDIVFLRDRGSNTPYIVVSANLLGSFKKRIAKGIIKVLNKQLSLYD